MKSLRVQLFVTVQDWDADKLCEVEGSKPDGFRVDVTEIVRPDEMLLTRTDALLGGVFNEAMLHARKAFWFG